MKWASLAIFLVLGAAAVGVVIALSGSPGGSRGSVTVPEAEREGGAPPPSAPVPTDAPAPSSAGTAEVPPPAGPDPGNPGPAAPPPRTGPPGPEDLERMRLENEAQARAHAEAAQKKKLSTFEEVMGPLGETAGEAFLEIYHRHYAEAYKAFRLRVDAARKKNIETGEPFVMPDRDEIYAEHRLKTYEELKDVLTAEQLEKFRTWWEEKCHPPKGK